MSIIDRFDGTLAGTPIKAPCRAATTAAITLEGIQAIDGVTLAEGDRVLVKDQASAAANGIYLVSASGWLRATDFDGARDAMDGSLVYVAAGPVNGDAIWRVSATNPIVFGTSAINFELVTVGSTATKDITFLTDSQNNTVDVSTLATHLKTGSSWDDTYTLTFTGTPPADGLDFWVINNSGHPQSFANGAGNPLDVGVATFSLPHDYAIRLSRGVTSQTLHLVALAPLVDPATGGEEGDVLTVQANGRVIPQAPTAATVNVDQYDLVGRLASGNGAAGGLASGDLTEVEAPAAGDFVPVWVGGTTLRKADVGDLPFVKTTGTPENADFARFTAAATIEGRSVSEARDDLGLGALAVLDDITTAEIDATAYADDDDVNTGTEDTKIVTVLKSVAVAENAIAAAIGTSIPALVHTHEVADITDAGALASKDTVASGDLATALSEAIFWPISTVLDSVATQVPEGYNTYTYANDSGGGTIVLLGSDIAAGEGVMLHHGGAVDPIIIPDNGFTINLSDQTDESPTTATITLQNASGATGQFAAAATLPDAAQGDIYRLTNHATGNGVYLVGATHTTSLWAVTRIDGENFANAGAESADVALVTPEHTLKSLSVIRRFDTDFVVLGGTSAAKGMDGSEVYDVLSPWQTGTGSFANAASGRSWNVTGNITAVPVLNGWFGTFKNESGSSKTIAGASGTFVNLIDGSTGTTLTLGDDRGCVLHANGTNIMVQGVVVLS